MESIHDETLMAYADGALDAATRARVDAALAADPLLKERLAPFIVTRRLPELFSEALTSPVPDRLVDTVLTAPIGTRRPVAGGAPVLQRVRDLLFPSGAGWAAFVPLTAAVALIAGAGWMAASLTPGTVTPQTDLARVAATSSEPLYAGGTLHLALESTPSNTPREGGLVKVRPMLTFRDHTGRFCRQYTMSEAGKRETMGLACRTDRGRWSIALHVPASNPSDAQGIVPADGGAASAPIEGAVDKLIAGDVLQTAEEQMLIARQWSQATP